MNLHYSVHAPLESMTVWVNDTVFYDMEKTPGEWIKAKLFGITCLPNRVPTFEIITAEGYVFSDIPPHMIKWKNSEEKCYDLESLVYNNSLSSEFVISHFPELKERHAFVFFKKENEYIKAQYWFSLDFYKNNNWYHCLKLDNGQFAFIPSHKIVFSMTKELSKEHKFPSYKKLRHEFKV